MYKSILFEMYKIKRLRSFVVSVVSKIENGDYFSETLRRIFSEYHNIVIGKYSYGCFDSAKINQFTRIGRYCSFASDISIFNGNHPIEHLSTHPFFFNPNLKYVDEEKIDRRWIDIGHDVWIGRNAIITPSVKKVGNGAIIAAGAIVTKDVPDFAIVGGNPAQIIKYRFDDKTIEEINRLQWWNKDIDELSSEINKFCKPFKLV